MWHNQHHYDPFVQLITNKREISHIENKCISHSCSLNFVYIKEKKKKKSCMERLTHFEFNSHINYIEVFFNYVIDAKYSSTFSIIILCRF